MTDSDSGSSSGSESDTAKASGPLNATKVLMIFMISVLMVSIEFCFLWS